MEARLQFSSVFVFTLFVVMIELASCLTIKHEPTKQQYQGKPNEFNCLVVGDWGGLPFAPYYTKYEMGTAKAMAVKAKETRSSCVFSLGDHFYSAGVTDEYDPRFNQTFETVFSDYPLTAIPWYMIGGNHDHVGNISGQIEYSKHSERWIYPKLWYKVEVPMLTFNVTVLIIDTIVLCGGTEIESPQPDGPDDVELAEGQWSFIEEVLSSSRSDYLLVMGHYPVYSIAEHGTEPCVYNRLKPMLEKYDVTAYFSGHDHNLQHILVNDTDYFVNGAANSINIRKTNLEDVPFGSLRFYWADRPSLGGYASVSANQTTMRVRFHRSDQSGFIYEQFIKSRNAAIGIHGVTEIFYLLCNIVVLTIQTNFTM